MTENELILSYVESYERKLEAITDLLNELNGLVKECMDECQQEVLAGGNYCTIGLISRIGPCTETDELNRLIKQAHWLNKVREAVGAMN